MRFENDGDINSLLEEFGIEASDLGTRAGVLGTEGRVEIDDDLQGDDTLTDGNGQIVVRIPSGWRNDL